MKRLSVLPACLALAVVGSTAARAAEPSPTPPTATTPIRELVAQLLSSEWQTVQQAKWQLESRQGEAIPALLALLDRREVVKLVNTLDLIYPGAETFYGHGYIIDYDLDYLPARAGWVLEELTFESFGFAERAIREEAFREHARQGGGDVPLAQLIPPNPAPRERRFEAVVARARAWGRAHAGKWSRFQALRATLTDAADAAPERQVRALSWLRFGTTRCDGLTVARYESELKPLVARLAASADRGVREQAGYLLADGSSWWSYKVDPELREGF